MGCPDCIRKFITHRSTQSLLDEPWRAIEADAWWLRVVASRACKGRGRAAG